MAAVKNEAKRSKMSVSSTMRGITVKKPGGPEVLQFASDLPVPHKPQVKQLLVSVKCAGVNPVDTYIRSGSHDTSPYTPGFDGAGVVLEVSDHGSKFKKGDRVYWFRCTTGSYAEQVLTNEAETFPLHDALSFQQGAALGIPYFTAYRALVTKARVQHGETVLVHGASGAVGIACCQIARSLGARVVGTAGTPEGLQIVVKNGAHTVFNHRQKGYTNKIKSFTDDVGCDVIVEMLANVNMESDLQLAGTKARIIIVGGHGKASFSPSLSMTNEVSIIGIAVLQSTQAELSEAAVFMAAGMESGWLRPVVGQEFTLEQAAEAHVEVIKHTNGAKGKIVLNV